MNKNILYKEKYYILQEKKIYILSRKIYLYKKKYNSEKTVEKYIYKIVHIQKKYIYRE